MPITTMVSCTLEERSYRCVFSDEKDIGNIRGLDLNSIDKVYVTPPESVTAFSSTGMDCNVNGERTLTCKEL